MRYRLFLLVLAIFAGAAMAQPSKPRVNIEGLKENTSLVMQAAYASFIASSCDMRDDFRERITKLAQAQTKYDNAAADYPLMLRSRPEQLKLGIGGTRCVDE